MLPAGNLLQIIWRRAWVVLMAIVVCLGIAWGYSHEQTPLYQASIKMLVGQDQGLLVDPSQVANLQNMAGTVSEAVTTRPVGEGVVKRLNMDSSPEFIVANTTAEPITNTQFIDVSYVDTNPRRAQQVANTIGDVVSQQIADVSPKANGVSVTVWERADQPSTPISPNTSRNLLMAVVIGAMLGVGLALLLAYLDFSWHSSEEAEQVSGVPTLGVIPKSTRPRARKMSSSEQYPPI